MSAAERRDSREAGWLRMVAADRQWAVANAVWQKCNESLDQDELVALITGKHGDELAQRFVETLSNGMRPPGGGPRVAFAHLCVRFRRLGLLERVITAQPTHGCGHTGLPTVDWVGRLCTRINEDGLVITSTLYEIGVAIQSTELARSMLELAMKYQPGHPSIHVAMQSGGPNSAILAELVMAQRVAESTTAAAASVPEVPRSSRRHRAL